MKYLILLFPTLAFAWPPHHDVTIEQTVENTYVEETYQTFEETINNYYADTSVQDEGIAIGIAMGSIPGVNHYVDGHSHTVLGIGAGYFNDESALAIGIESQLSGNLSFRFNVGASQSESAVGMGFSFGL